MTGQGCLDGGSLKKHWVPVDHMSHVTCLFVLNPCQVTQLGVQSEDGDPCKGKNGSDLCGHMHIELAEDRVPGTSSSVPH